jgi:hypothetical protein
MKVTVRFRRSVNVRVKSILEAIVGYNVIKRYSWTGKSALNSDFIDFIFNFFFYFNFSLDVDQKVFMEQHPSTSRCSNDTSWDSEGGRWVKDFLRRVGTNARLQDKNKQLISEHINQWWNQKKYLRLMSLLFP